MYYIILKWQFLYISRSTKPSWLIVLYIDDTWLDVRNPYFTYRMRDERDFCFWRVRALWSVTSVRFCFCCLCNAAFASLQFLELGDSAAVLLAGNTFGSRFFDEKHYPNVFTSLHFYSICHKCSESFACIFLLHSQQV